MSARTAIDAAQRLGSKIARYATGDVVTLTDEHDDELPRIADARSLELGGRVIDETPLWDLIERLPAAQAAEFSAALTTYSDARTVYECAMQEVALVAGWSAARWRHTRLWRRRIDAQLERLTTSDLRHVYHVLRMFLGDTRGRT